MPSSSSAAASPSPGRASLQIDPSSDGRRVVFVLLQSAASPSSSGDAQSANAASPSQILSSPSSLSKVQNPIMKISSHDLGAGALIGSRSPVSSSLKDS